MSKITNIYDTILKQLNLLFPNKTRVPNAYSLVDNNKNLLRDGYGLIIGDANYEEHEFCTFVVNRTITVVFTREMFRVDSATKESDDIIKSLLESVYQVQDVFYSYNELGIEEKILKIDIGSVSGIESFMNEKQNFLSMSASFQFFIQEEIK